MRLWQGVFSAMVGSYMTIDINKSGNLLILFDPCPAQIFHELERFILQSQFIEFTPDCLDLRTTVKAQHNPQITHAAGFDLFGSFYPKQCHECQHQEHGLQPIVSFFKGTICVFSDFQIIQLHQKRQCQKDTGILDAFVGGKFRCSFLDQAFACHDPIHFTFYCHSGFVPGIFL